MVFTDLPDVLNRLRGFFGQARYIQTEDIFSFAGFPALPLKAFT